MVRKFGYLCIRKTFGNHMTILAPITKQPQQQQSQVRLKVFTDMENRERAIKALDKRQRRRISLEEKHENWPG